MVSRSTVVPLLFLALFWLAISEATYLYQNSYIGMTNDRPIIGVLSQETWKGNQSYIAAPYVKFLEGAGARVIPIRIGKNYTYYSKLMKKINGVLWPGGSASFTNKKGYADAAEHIYKIAKNFNVNGDYFPILGVCLGFELLSYLTSNRKLHRKLCSAENIALPLNFQPDFQESHMYGNAPREIIEILQHKNVTMNFHHFCITREELQHVHITNNLKVLSLNNDINGVEFISSVESTKYPFYGVQFHPEKNLYNWEEDEVIAHDKSAVKASQYFANFFVNEARKSTHTFSSAAEEAETLIYNYPVTYLPQKNGKVLFRQMYLFPHKSSQ